MPDDHRQQLGVDSQRMRQMRALRNVSIEPNLFQSLNSSSSEATCIASSAARIGAAVRITGMDGITLIVEPVSAALEAPREVHTWTY